MLLFQRKKSRFLLKIISVFWGPGPAPAGPRPQLHFLAPAPAGPRPRLHLLAPAPTGPRPRLYFLAPAPAGPRPRLRFLAPAPIGAVAPLFNFMKIIRILVSNIKINDTRKANYCLLARKTRQKGVDFSRRRREDKTITSMESL